MPMSTEYLKISTNYSTCREKFLYPTSLVLKNNHSEYSGKEISKMVKQRIEMNDTYIDVMRKTYWA